MKIWVGVTDEDWFVRLKHLEPDEVNFWQPSGGRAFRALAPGEPFLFKLHSPKNVIVGGGFFVSHTPLPTSLAWDTFGIKNGVGSLREPDDREAGEPDRCVHVDGDGRRAHAELGAAQDGGEHARSLPFERRVIVDGGGAGRSG